MKAWEDSKMFKKAQTGSIRFNKAQDGSRRVKKVIYGSRTNQTVKEGLKRFEKVHGYLRTQKEKGVQKVSEGTKNVLEESRRFQNVI